MIRPPLRLHQIRFLAEHKYCPQIKYLKFPTIDIEDTEKEDFTSYDYDMTTFETGTNTDEGDSVFKSSVTWSWYPMSWPWTSILRLNSAIIGIVGNAIVIIVVFNRRVSKNSTDILIGSLAVADLLSSIAIIPVPRIKYVPSTWLGEVYCRVVNGQIFMWFFVNVSIFILTAISVERYVAVIYPFTFRRIFSMRRTTVYIILIWTACVINYVTYFYFFIKVHHATHTCKVPTDPTVPHGFLVDCHRSYSNSSVLYSSWLSPKQ